MKTAIFFGLALFSLLVADAIVLAAATLCKRQIPLPWRRRGLRFTFGSALPILGFSLYMTTDFLHRGLVTSLSRGFSLAFWPVSSGTIALLAWLSLRHLAKSDPPSSALLPSMEPTGNSPRDNTPTRR